MDEKTVSKNAYYNENTILYLNGEFVKSNTATTDLYSQSLHYGYAVFEGIRAYKIKNGVAIFKEKEHYERLKRSCELINIPFNFDVEELVKKSYELLKLNNLEDAYIRPLVFCSPNMSLTRPNQVSIMICVWEWGAYLGDNLLNIAISSYSRPHPKSVKIEAKAAGYYINSILATTEAKDNGFDEALLLDVEGNLAEGPGANLFFEKSGQLFTPKTGHILPGITRATVMELCQNLNVELIEGTFTSENLLEADSAFYCGTAAEVVGIKSVNKHEFSLHWENSLGKKIQTAYKKLVTKQ